MSCPTMLVIDFETTGLDPFRASPVSFGAVLVANDGVLAERSGLVRPRVTAPLRSGFSAAHAIHGIGFWNALVNGLSAKEVVARFEHLRRLAFEKTGEYPVIAAQNTHFDYHLLRGLYKRAGVPFTFSHRTVDLPSVALVKIGVSSTRQIAEKLGIPDGKHDALQDARFAALALLKLTSNSKRAMPPGVR